MNALDIAVLQKESHARVARDVAALPAHQRLAAQMQLDMMTGLGDHHGDFDETIRVLRGAGLQPTPGALKTEAEARAYQASGDAVRHEDFARRVGIGVTHGSTEAFENLKRAARDAARRQDEESGRTPGGDPAASCGRCGRACDRSRETFKACARCRTTRYCSRACQKAHWSIHKKYCTALLAGR